MDRVQADDLIQFLTSISEIPEDKNGVRTTKELSIETGLTVKEIKDRMRVLIMDGKVDSVRVKRSPADNIPGYPALYLQGCSVTGWRVRDASD